MGSTPLLVMDMWEHAYYLQYKNKKEKWIVAFWELINWADVARRLATAESADLALDPDLQRLIPARLKGTFPFGGRRRSG